MITISLLAAVATMRQDMTLAPVELLVTANYSTKLTDFVRRVPEWASGTKSASISGAYKMDQPPRLLSWNLGLAAPSEVRRTKGYQGGLPNTDDFARTLPSETPLGGEVLFIQHRNRVTLLSASPYERLSVGIEETGSQPDNLLTEADVPVVERFGRVLMARGAGLRLVNPWEQVLNGVTVHFATCRKSNRTFVRLDEWAQARGWTSSLSNDKNVESLRKGGQTAQVPLASQSIKIAGAWQEMADIVAEKDGVWWIGTDGCSMIQGG